MKLFFGLFSCLFLLTGCDFLHNMNLGMFSPMGEIAYEEMRLLIICVLLMLIVVVPVLIMIPIFAFKYRASNEDAKYEPKWGHNTMIEVVCWGSSGIIITILAIITWSSSHKLDPYRPLEHASKPIKIQAIAMQWKWLFIYPEQNIALVNYLHIPVDVPINVEITADAPMNSLMIPQLGGQIYAMEGMTTKIHWIANQQGEFRGHSSNYSGHGFAGMGFKVKATNQKEFDAFVKSVKASNSPLTMKVYNVLAEKSMNNPPQYFSSVEQDLFGKVLAKFTQYMPHQSNEKTKARHLPEKADAQKKYNHNHH